MAGVTTIASRYVKNGLVRDKKEKKTNCLQKNFYTLPPSLEHQTHRMMTTFRSKRIKIDIVFEIWETKKFYFSASFLYNDVRSVTSSSKPREIDSSLSLLESEQKKTYFSTQSVTIAAIAVGTSCQLLYGSAEEQILAGQFLKPVQNRQVGESLGIVSKEDKFWRDEPDLNMGSLDWVPWCPW